jgi:glycosyltransferase involved in cell wall biosynthesis
MKKKILFISFYFPTKISSGAEFRIYYLLQSLLIDHEVTWLSHLPENVNVSDIFFNGNKNLSLKIASPLRKDTSGLDSILGTISKLYFFLFGNKKIDQYFLYKNLIKTISLDNEITNHNIIFLYYFAYNKFVKFLKNKFIGIPIFIDTNDVQFERYGQIYKESSKIKYLLKQYSLMRFERDEKKALNKIDYVISLSQSDSNKFKDFGCKNVINIPQGVITKEKKIISKDLNNIAFFGSMNATANISAAKYFIEKIYPYVKEKVADVKYFIAGSNPTAEIYKLNSEDTVITGYIENIEKFFDSIKCVVCPFNFTYGQRTRILEVMSLGIPCVVTSKAVDGMGLENRNGIFIEDNEKQFAQIVIELLRNDELRIEQSKYAYNYIKNNYSIEKTFNKLNKIIGDL